jgi:hypothetical protein
LSKKIFNNNQKLTISNFDPEAIFNQLNNESSPNKNSLNLKSPQIFLKNEQIKKKFMKSLNVKSLIL